MIPIIILPDDIFTLNTRPTPPPRTHTNTRTPNVTFWRIWNVKFDFHIVLMWKLISDLIDRCRFEASYFYTTMLPLASCKQECIHDKTILISCCHPNSGRHMMMSSNGNIFRVTGHLCGEFTGRRWIPRTKASDAELWCFLRSAPE